MLLTKSVLGKQAFDLRWNIVEIIHGLGVAGYKF
jgi:hypothetical protein